MWPRSLQPGQVRIFFTGRYQLYATMVWRIGCNHRSNHFPNLLCSLGFTSVYGTEGLAEVANYPRVLAPDEVEGTFSRWSRVL